MDLAEDHLRKAGLAACLEAERLWGLDIRDPAANVESIEASRCRGLIDGFIQEGLGWRRGPYKGDGDFAWCGAFVAWCWKSAGLRATLREHFFASTRRLDKYGLGEEPGGGRKAIGRRRLVLTNESTDDDVQRFKPQSGDLLLVGSEDPGAHIALLSTYEGGTFLTLEGNGFGRGPSGSKREGVVKRERELAQREPRVLRIIRPSVEDLETWGV